jgi:hypothetical protein
MSRQVIDNTNTFGDMSRRRVQEVHISFLLLLHAITTTVKSCILFGSKDLVLLCVTNTGYCYFAQPVSVVVTGVTLPLDLLRTEIKIVIKGIRNNRRATTMSLCNANIGVAAVDSSPVTSEHHQGTL